MQIIGLRRSTAIYVIAAALCVATLCAMTPLSAQAATVKDGTAAKLVQVAEKEYKSVTATYGSGAQSYATEVRLAKKYVEFVEGEGAAPEPWCADFASWCLNKAGYTKLYGATKHAYHHDFALDVLKGKATGTVHRAIKSYTPKKGDLVIRCASSCGFDCGKGSTGEHVAIVSSVSSDGKTFKTIGGNESNNICKKTYYVSDNTWDWFVTYGEVKTSDCAHRKTSSVSTSGWKGTECDNCGAISVTRFCGGGIHEYKKVAGKAATCSEKGYTAYKQCKGCGKISGKESIAKIAHDWGDWEVATVATCTADGTEKRTCKVCGKVGTRVGDKATGHNWGEWEITKAATCTVAGSKERKCKDCKKSESAVLASTGHTWSEWATAKAATCTQAGAQVRKCDSCGKTETRAGDKAIGHTWSEWTVTKNATCTKTGVKKRVCEGCGKTESASISTTGHIWSKWTIAKKATCTKEGSKERACSVCGEKQTKAVSKTGHSVAIATCTSAKRCTACGKTWGDSLEHSYKTIKAKAATCTKAGYTAYKVCTRCKKKKGYTAIAATGHKYNKAGKCKVCGAKKAVKKVSSN